MSDIDMPPAKQVIYPSVGFAVGHGPDGRKVLTFVTPTETLVFPLDDDGARALAKELVGVEVATPADLAELRGNA